MARSCVLSDMNQSPLQRRARSSYGWRSSSLPKYDEKVRSKVVVFTEHSFITVFFSLDPGSASFILALLTTRGLKAEQMSKVSFI